MKRIIIFLNLIICVTLLNAQDIIITKDSKRIEAKITEINTTTIKYKKWNYQDGPDIYENKNNIAVIMWGNGEVEVFNNEEKQDTIRDSINTKQKITKQKVVTKKNTVIAKTDNNYIVSNNSLSLVKLEDGDYMCDGKSIASENIREFYANNCYDAYLMYKKARNTSIAGYTLLTCGSTLALCGSLTMIGDLGAGLGLMITGLVFDIACIPTLCVAIKQNNKAMDIYNQRCTKKELATINFGTTTNGIGFSINF